jgi:O-antigen/teichoic acid export membrane protein
MAAGVPLARLLADGNETVQTYLTVGFLLLPVSMAGATLVDLMGGLERWRVVIFMRAVPIMVPFVGIVVMYMLDEMTVPRVVIATMAGGAISIVPAVAVVARAGRPVFRRATARASVSFGLRSWVGGLALVANVRLDQLLMITLVDRRELGLYAVAVTLAGLSSFVIGALGPPLVTRVAQGETSLVPRALRVVLAAVGSINLAAAAVTPVVLPAIFGADFEDAVNPAIVLLIAGVPLAGIMVLAASLAAAGAPGRSSIGEGTALIITIPGLFLLVPSLGGLGAAMVSLAAYSVSFSYQLLVTRRRLGGSLRSYLLPHAEDARWAVALLMRRRRSA